VKELRPGVWHWTSRHPVWSKEEGWPQVVSSYVIDLGDDFVLFDPLAARRSSEPSHKTKRARFPAPS
jgi:hypothetical protein